MDIACGTSNLGRHTHARPTITVVELQSTSGFALAKVSMASAPTAETTHGSTGSVQDANERCPRSSLAEVITVHREVGLLDDRPHCPIEDQQLRVMSPRCCAMAAVESLGSTEVSSRSCGYMDVGLIWPCNAVLRSFKPVACRFARRTLKSPTLHLHAPHHIHPEPHMPLSGTGFWAALPPAGNPLAAQVHLHPHPHSSTDPSAV